MRVLLAAPLSIFLVGPLQAQVVLTCATPVQSCNARAMAPGQPVTLNVRVTSGPPGDQPLPAHPVDFQLKSAGLKDNHVLLASVNSNNQGIATFVWTGVTESQPVFVIAHTTRGATVSTVEFRITPARPGQGTFLRFDGNDQLWRPGHLLEYPLVVRFTPPAGTSCGSHTVLFTPEASGTAFPDTATASGMAECSASTRWILGSHVGDHRLSVRIPSARITEQANAFARKSGRISAALAATLYFGFGEYDGILARADTAVVTTTTVSGTTQTTRTTREITSRDTTTVVDPRRLQVDPLIGIDFPIRKRLRIYVAASARNPTNVWAAGVEILQYLHPGSEATGVGFYIGARGERRDEAECSGSVCRKVSKFRIQGPTVFLAVDAASLLSNLLKAVGAV